MAKKPSKKTAKAPKKDGGDDAETPREGLKLGTVVTMVSFHDEENESLRYDAKANADMCSVLEAFFGVDKSAWDNFATLPTNNEVAGGPLPRRPSAVPRLEERPWWSVTRSKSGRATAGTKEQCRT